MQPINMDFNDTYDVIWHFSSRNRKIILLTIFKIKAEGMKEREGSNADILAIMFAIGIEGE